MDLGIAGRTAVVTGAGRGIGLAITRALVDEGARVVAGSREVTAELGELTADGRVVAVAVDLAEPTGPAELIAAATAAFGGLDILVNNVGAVRPRTGGFLTVTDDDWGATLTVNFLAAVRTTRAALPILLGRGAGSIVTVSSVNAFLPDPLVIDYGAAKAALSNFCKALSKEIGPHGIRVNTVSPGPVATALWTGPSGVAATVALAAGGTADDVARQAAADAATGRFTRPEEVADLVVYLTGDRAANITGSDFTIDGGLVTTL
ncbi:SDR family NAD(P)-dependent oxidoreductase [Embleya sp. NPDC056575]|uniref:SDR family NAD(P)-dependent oxidoreductase n=1 Tax=unclassified Embleya TaxID=2699296 RepID=UPI0036BD62AE